jgi:hypothetical protein
MLDRPSKFEPEFRLPAASKLWMRSLRFAGLLRILHAASKLPRMFSPSDLDNTVLSGNLYETVKGRPPSKTTLYHCKNCLIRLKILRKHGRRLSVDSINPLVQDLLSQTTPSDWELSPGSRELFAELVLQNDDCWQLFFSFFFMGKNRPSIAEFRRRALPVRWLRVTNEESDYLSLKRSDDTEVIFPLKPVLHSLLYGVRYWARDELKMVDEILDDRGCGVMFAVLGEDTLPAKKLLLDLAFHYAHREGDWLLMSVRETIERLAVEQHIPLAAVFESLLELIFNHPQFVVPVYTSNDFAALTAGSRKRDVLALRRYLVDSSGRSISHIRVYVGPGLNYDSLTLKARA